MTGNFRQKVKYERLLLNIIHYLLAFFRKTVLGSIPSTISRQNIRSEWLNAVNPRKIGGKWLEAVIIKLFLRRAETVTRIDVQSNKIITRRVRTAMLRSLKLIVLIWYSWKKEKKLTKQYTYYVYSA